jgi:diguanylate cyclase (GGDEF)-like protein
MDLLLVEVAERLKHCVRETDTVARFGGDEFVVLLGELGTETASAETLAAAVAEKIRMALAEPYVLHPEGVTLPVTHRCTSSIGMALFHGAEFSVEEILDRADAAMYQSKHAGGNRVSLYSA